MEPDPDLDLENFLRSANRELRIALSHYQEVVNELIKDPTNVKLKNLKDETEQNIIRIGLQEKKYFNLMRKRRDLFEATHCEVLREELPSGCENPPESNDLVDIEMPSDTVGITDMEVQPVKKSAKCLSQAAQEFRIRSAGWSVTLLSEKKCQGPKECMKQGDFLQLVHLVPIGNLSTLRRRRAERKKRSTEDSQFVYESCGGKEGVNDDLDEVDTSLSPVKTPRKRGRPRIKPLEVPQTASEETAVNNEETKTVNEDAQSTSDVKVRRKRGRPRIKQPDSNDIDCGGVSTNTAERTKVTRREVAFPIMQRYVRSIADPCPSTSKDCEECKDSSRLTKYFLGKKVVALLKASEKEPDMPDHLMSVPGNAGTLESIRGDSKPSDPKIVMVKCSICTNNYPLVPTTAVNKTCYTCIDGKSVGSSRRPRKAVFH